MFGRGVNQKFLFGFVQIPQMTLEAIGVGKVQTSSSLVDLSLVETVASELLHTLKLGV